MGARSLDIYVNNFMMGPKGGRVDDKFFGEDINEFSREQLLAVVDFLCDALDRSHNDNKRTVDFYKDVVKLKSLAHE